MKQIGLRGLLVGALGSVLPLCIGIGIGSAFGLEVLIIPRLLHSHLPN